MSKNVFVIAEQRDGKIMKVSYELIGKARELANDLGQDVIAVLMGSGIEAVAGCGHLLGQRLFALLDAAVAYVYHAVGLRCNLRVVRYQHQRLAAFVYALAHQGHYLAAGAAVQIAGRLVGQYQRGLVYHCARDSDALLLAARELAGEFVALVGKPDLLQHRVDCALVRAFAVQHQRHADVLLYGQHRYDVEKLKYKPDAPPPERGQLLLGFAGNVGAVDNHAPAAGPVDCAQQVEQRALAAARRAAYRDEFAAFDGYIDVVQRVHGVFAGAVGFA